MRAIAFLTASILIFLSSEEAFAEGLLQDQAVAMTPGPSGWAISDRNAQTVTSGITGTLVQVDVQIFQSNEFAEGDLWVDIFGTLPNGLPDIPTDGVPLASSLIETKTSLPLKHSAPKKFLQRQPVFYLPICILKQVRNLPFG